MTNLVSNATKYGAQAPVDVRVTREDGHACVRVTDHGIGIDQNDRNRIFMRFERAVPTANYCGFGLGLWISREIVTSHGGTIEVESAVGSGSTFTVRLPIEISSSRGL